MKQGTIHIRRGLDLPIDGGPEPVVENGPPIASVALLGDDYPGMRPRFHVSEGDRVKAGDLLFTDRKNERIRFTSPVTGTVRAIHRGTKRRFLSLVIRREDGDPLQFEPIPDHALTSGSELRIRELLLHSGLFTAFRGRPFDRIPDPDRRPDAIFVTAMDSRPLALDPGSVILQHADPFRRGLTALTCLTDGPVHLCKSPGIELPGQDIHQVQTTSFDGPHPSGLPGTHIHFLRPVGREKRVWVVSYADLIEFGYLLQTGRLHPDRIVALGGPALSRPRHIRTIRGASLTDLLKQEGIDPDARIISGSVLYGHAGTGPVAFLGRHHLQVSVIPEGRNRRFLGWLFPDAGLFSVKRGPVARFLNRRGFRFTTNLQGSPRAMVPIGVYEKVMPLDILPTFLVRSMAAGDLEEAEALGVLELGEEDMTALTFVDPGKTDLAALLRQTLTRIEKEG